MIQTAPCTSGTKLTDETCASPDVVKLLLVVLLLESTAIIATATAPITSGKAVITTRSSMRENPSSVASSLDAIISKQTGKPGTRSRQVPSHRAAGSCDVHLVIDAIHGRDQGHSDEPDD